MRVLLAGGAGVIGRHLIPLLVDAGHQVTATTRKRERFELLASLGAEPVTMDALDRASVSSAFEIARPGAVVHQLTDLAGLDFAGNTRVRVEGTRNLVDAAQAHGVGQMIAQSIAWVVAPGKAPATEEEPLAPDATPGVRELEHAVAELPQGVVLRYGLLYGPGTWYSHDGLRAEEARAHRLDAMAEITNFVHVADAAAAAVDALGWPTGVVNIVDDEPARAEEWMPVFAAAVGAPAPQLPTVKDLGRPLSNAKARSLGWSPRYPDWREGFSTAL